MSDVDPKAADPLAAKPPIPREDGPDLKPTVEMSEREILRGMVQKSIDIGLANSSGINALTGTVNTVNLAVGQLHVAVSALDERVTAVEQRQDSTSVRVAPLLTHDAEQAAALAAEVAKREEQERAIRETRVIAEAAAKDAKTAAENTASVMAQNATQTVLLQKVLSFADKPLVQKIGRAAGALLVLILTALAARYSAPQLPAPKGSP